MLNMLVCTTWPLLLGHVSSGTLALSRKVQCTLQVAEERAAAAVREAAASEERATLEFSLQELTIARTEAEEQLAGLHAKEASLAQQLEAVSSHNHQLQGVCPHVMWYYGGK